MAARETSRSFGPFLAIFFVGCAIYATLANIESYQRSSPPATSVTGQPPVPIPNQSTSSATNAAGPRSVSQRPIPVVREVNDPPPVQSLEIPSSALAKNGSSTEAPNSDKPITAQPVLELVAPAPGCKKLPSDSSVYNICQRLDQQACDSNPLCSRGTGPSCSPREGASASSDPLGSPDYADYVELSFLKIGEPNRLQIGNALIAKKRFDLGIAEYTRALRSDPNWPEVLMNRAMAYEATGDKPRAIADYCKILVIYSKRERRAFALGRIAQLQGTKAPLPIPVVADRTAKPGLPAPSTGDILPRRGRNAIAPFTVLTESGQNYFIKLVNVGNARDQIWIYVKGGESYSTKVPLGTYNFRAATGNEWYGREDLFGPNTGFFRLRTKNGAAVDAQQKLEFRKERNRIFGMTISLKGVANGNMEQEVMTRSQFDAN